MKQKNRHISKTMILIVLLTISFLNNCFSVTGTSSSEFSWEEGQYWDYNIFKINKTGAYQLMYTAKFEVKENQTIKINDNKTIECRIINMSIILINLTTATPISGNILENAIFYYSNDLELIKFDYISPFPEMNVTIIFNTPIESIPSPLSMFSIEYSEDFTIGDIGYFADYPIYENQNWYGIVNFTVFLRSFNNNTYTSSMKYKNNVEFANKNLSTKLGNIACNKIKQIANVQNDDSIKTYLFSDEIGLFPIMINYTHERSGFNFVAELVDYYNIGNTTTIDNDDKHSDSTPGFELIFIFSCVIFFLFLFLRRKKSNN
jgi:hypothetical protein